ncbi:MAG TPA: sigma-70 family RNA polymerase sigma factor, partial [Gemmata sp.]|nr:sigma-70 family RNA polymerase sigma factor [Gemmata sp.]
MNPFADLIRRSTSDPRTDGELLAAFISDRDDPAFAELVRRHGHLVWGACRRTLSETSDAEDAFQATFLVLVRRARRLINSSTIGPWLYKVASWTAANVRRKNARHQARFAELPEAVPDGRTSSVSAIDIDAVLLGLPERYRNAVIMCCIAGMTHREAAAQLGCAEGTVSSLLSRGLAKLRSKLAGRDPATLLAITVVAVPVGIAEATIRSAVSLRLASLSTTASPAVSALTRGVLRMFWIRKATTMALATALLIAAGICVGMTKPVDSLTSGQEKTVSKKADSPALPQSAPKPADPISANGEIVGRLIDKASGKPISGAKIACGAVFTDSGELGGSNSITDADGRYRLTVPSPGIYLVWLKEYDKEPTKTAAADDGILVEAGKISASVLQLQEGRKIKGTVVNSDGSPSANLEVSCHSAAQPHAGGVDSVKTKDDGTFEFHLPPGRAYLYATEYIAKTKDNPFGIGKSAHAHIEVSATKELAPIKLALKATQSKFGDTEWLNRSTPGTQIVRRIGNQDVTGTIVDVNGQPVKGARVFREDGPIVAANEKGEFRMETLKGTQFIMHAFAPGHHLWFGTPTSGDVLKIVLEPKTKPEVKTPEKPKSEVDKESKNAGMKPIKIRVYIEKVDVSTSTITASCMTLGEISDGFKPLKFENLGVSGKAKITDRGKPVRLADLKLDTGFFLFLEAHELGFEVVGIE